MVRKSLFERACNVQGGVLLGRMESMEGNTDFGNGTGILTDKEVYEACKYYLDNDYNWLNHYDPHDEDDKKDPEFIRLKQSIKALKYIIKAYESRR